MLEQLLTVKGFAIDIEAYPRDITLKGKNKIKDASLHHKKNVIRCIGFASKDVNFCLTYKELIDNKVLFKEIMTNPNIKKVGHFFKFDLKTISEHFGFLVEGIYFDTGIASWLLNENESHSLENLVQVYLKREPWKFDYSVQHCPEEWIDLCKQDAKNTYDLAEVQFKKLENENLWDSKTNTGLFSTEMTVMEVFYKAELKGIPVDVEQLKRLKVRYSQHVARVKNWLILHTQEREDGKDINFNSPKQLTEILYFNKKLPILGFTKTKNPSTDKNTLAKLCADGHRYAAALLIYRYWSKLTEFSNKLIEDSIDGKIYPTFNTIGADTGRFSCQQPNLQQIPSKTLEGKNIRKAIYGNMTIFDYSNMELRILAHYTRDPNLLEVYKEGGSGDIHAKTAELIGRSRDQAKQVNFLMVYGGGPNTLMEKINIDQVHPWKVRKEKVTKEEARQMINKWYEAYSCVQPWKNEVLDEAKKYGFIRTLGGRKRRIDFNNLKLFFANDPKFKNAYKETLVSAAERKVVNFPIQGTSADIVKLTIVALKDQDLRMQVHDELIDFSSNLSVEEFKRIAENVIKLKIPMTVDCKKCNNWKEGK